MTTNVTEATLGIGIIGCGNISTTYLEMLPLFRHIQAIACADINMDTARSMAREFSIEARTVEQLLASEDIDIVLNLTVPVVHAEVTRQILQAGKHVYSEKPLGLNLDEVASIADLAAKQQCHVACAPDTWFGGAHQLAREVVDSGRIGKITQGSCHVLSHGMEDWHPNPDFFFQPGAGPVLDLAPYYIGALVNLIGPVKRVVSMSATPSETRTIGNGEREGETVPVDTPTTIHALLEFESSALVTFISSWDVWAHEHNNIELYGTEGTLFATDPNFFEGELRIALRGEETLPVPPMDHPFNVINQEHENGDRANYRGAGLADMAAAILHGRPIRCSLERTLHAVEVMQAILESAEEGRFIDIKSCCDRPEALDGKLAGALLRP